MRKPELLIGIERDLQPLESVCKEYIDFVDSPEYQEDNDFRHYIFEQALISLYGEKVFEWINSKI